MAAPKRTKLQREADLETIERLHNFGYSGRAIGRKLSLDEGTIRRDLETITQRYREATLSERIEAVNRQLASLCMIRKEALEAWERSKDDATREVRETIRRMDAKKSASQQATKEEAVEKLKVLKTTEGRLPANEYLTTILKTFQDEAELLGLYAPKELRHAGPGGEPLTITLIEEIVTTHADPRPVGSEDSTPPGTTALPPE